MTTPDLVTLRALVRGQLDSASRRAVARWLVRHADGAVAATLDALAMEWRELQRDQALPEELRGLGEVFWTLAERGLAELDPDPQPMVVPVLRTTPSVQGDLSWHLTDEPARRVHLDARMRATAWATLAATNDAGELHVLHAGPHLAGGALPIANEYVCAPSEGRVTFWLVATRLGRTSFGALETAVREARESDPPPRALRLTSDSFVRD